MEFLSIKRFYVQLKLVMKVKMYLQKRMNLHSYATLDYLSLMSFLIRYCLRTIKRK